MAVGQDSALDELERLIVTAFIAARDGGKAEWKKMRVAVLKNRLLQLSKGKFNEQRYGSSTFRELLSKYSKLIRIDSDSVELLNSPNDNTIEPLPELRFRKIRGDLWQAILDFPSGKKYAWDRSEQRSREAHHDDLLVLPTLTEKEIIVWRTDFAVANGALSSLESWKQTGNIRELPSELKGKWNEFIKGKVASRLQEWFKSQSIDVNVFDESSTYSRKQETSVESIRKIVSACISVMTADELAEMRLPPSAVQRAALKGLLS